MDRRRQIELVAHRAAKRSKVPLRGVVTPEPQLRSHQQFGRYVVVGVERHEVFRNAQCTRPVALKEGGVYEHTGEFDRGGDQAAFQLRITFETGEPAIAALLETVKSALDDPQLVFLDAQGSGVMLAGHRFECMKVDANVAAETVPVAVLVDDSVAAEFSA